MEESLSLLGQLKKEFDCKEVDIKAYSPLTLAYIGDCIYDVIIRTVVVERGNRTANKLHKTTVKYVNAGTQAAMIEALQEHLTQEEEVAVYRRGECKVLFHCEECHGRGLSQGYRYGSFTGYLYLTDRLESN